MSLRPTKPQSIASQLVLLFTLAAAVLLCTGLGLVYLLVVRHAFEEDNQFLNDKIDAVRADLKTAGWADQILAELKNHQAGEPTAYWIRIIDSTGQTVAETPGMAELLPARLFSVHTVNSGLARPQDYRTDGKLFSLAETTGTAHRQAYTLQIAQDRSADANFSRRFGALLVFMLLLGILASTLIGMTVTRHGLRPLTSMTQALQRVGPTNLSERVAPGGWPRELRPLAVAFDEMLDRLQDSFRRLSQFSADLAHELRTPVANLLGEAQVILSRERSREEYREVIESSVVECERLSGIIDNLLFLARADAAKEQIQRTSFDARTAAENIATYYQTIAEEKQTIINCSGEGEIYADPTLFGRALSNLVDNALRFVPAGGSIQITIDATDPEQCQISVSDTGNGISEEHLAHVFDRFYRADMSRSSNGAGLGLALVKSIAELHGGSVTIHSQVNCGTTVILHIPKASSLG
jgi:two-component system heavy metal sensor histidine kinase CusS